MNNDPRKKKQKNNFQKNFLKLMNNVVFGKTMESVRKHTYIKLFTTEGRRNISVSEPNYHATELFTENILATEMKKTTEILMNKPVYLGLSIIELRKILMYDF